METWKVGFLGIVFFMAYGCAKQDSSAGEEQGAGIEVVDGEFDENEDQLIEDEILGGDDEFLVDGESGGDDFFVEDGTAPIEEGDVFAEEAPMATGVVEDNTQGLETGFAQEPSTAMPMASESGNSMQKTYSVKSGETLMLIAFKLYGDYTRWRELARLNSGVLGGGTTISAGMQLSYMSDGADFVWNPEGEPYLIKRGDTLGKISGKVYGTTSKWRKIWDNNRPLIKDPNKIFAGFTLYYLLDNSSVATR